MPLHFMLGGGHVPLVCTSLAQRPKEQLLHHEIELGELVRDVFVVQCSILSVGAGTSTVTGRGGESILAPEGL